MIDIKRPEQIEIMQQGGEILSDVVNAICKAAKPGVSELELDVLAEKLIREKGGESGFKRVQGYMHAICTCVNEIVVHGVPTNYRLKDGDIIDIDCGVYYQGFHTDMCETIRVREEKKRTATTDEIDVFLQTGKHALEEAIKQAVAGKRIGHISKTIQSVVEERGYSVVRSLIGHGVGRSLHEEPEVPGYLDVPIASTPPLKPGMTIAIEVIYNMGGPEVVYGRDDNWTISTKDGSLSAVFERSIAITNNRPLILTP